MASPQAARYQDIEREVSMKRTYSSLTLIIACLGIVLGLTVIAAAQNREKFLISAQAGGVNAVSGRVEITPSRGTDWSLLSVTDNLKTGDIVRTASDGRVEMLLNPGAYFRVGENSEFELTDNSLENLQVRLTRGTTIIEATGADETELAINITTPHAKMVIVKRGLYRVNVTPGDTTELFVRKGRVMLADTHTKVKEGNKVIFSSTTFSVAKIQKTEKGTDLIEGWSKDRGKTVALANNKLPSKDLDRVLGGLDDYWWATYSARGGGVWLFSPYYSCFTFFPFGIGWGSPYGSSYSRTFGCAFCGPNYLDRRQVYGTPGIADRGWPQGSTPTTGPSTSPMGTGNSGPRPGAGSSSDWPGRSVGKPDTNPRGGGQSRPISN